MDKVRVLMAVGIAITALFLTGCAEMAAGPDPGAVLAPSGKLRVGVYLGSPASLLKDPATGEARGVTVDLGMELARRLGVPFELVVFQRTAEVIAALRAGGVDFTVTNATAERAKFLDFTPPVLAVELGYLVLPGSAVAALADVDRPGMRIGVNQGSSSQASLTRAYKHAAVVPAPNLKAAGEMLTQRKLDAYATNKAILFEMADGLPGARILDGRWGVEHMAIGIPQGRQQGMAFLRKFVEDAQREGLIRQAIERAGLRGTSGVSD